MAEDAFAPLDNRFLAAFDPDVYAKVSKHLTPINMESGVTLWETGVPTEIVYFPITGMISIVIPTRDGIYTEAAAIGRFGAVGVHAGLGKRHSLGRAITQIGGRFAAINAREFRSIVADAPSVRELIALYTEVLWADAQYLAVCNNVHNAQQRLCRWLLRCADITNSEVVPLTHEFLAQMLGVNRTTVTLLARSLQDAGLISYSRGRISILDRKRLEDSSCECYNATCWENLSRWIGVKL